VVRRTVLGPLVATGVVFAVTSIWSEIEYAIASSQLERKEDVEALIHLRRSAALAPELNWLRYGPTYMVGINLTVPDDVSLEIIQTERRNDPNNPNIMIAEILRLLHMQRVDEARAVYLEMKRNWPQTRIVKMFGTVFP
jgi:hypothetical protein